MPRAVPRAVVLLAGRPEERGVAVAEAGCGIARALYMKLEEGGS